jgi:hypothetical protein
MTHIKKQIPLYLKQLAAAYCDFDVETATLNELEYAVIVAIEKSDDKVLFITRYLEFTDYNYDTLLYKIANAFTGQFFYVYNIYMSIYNYIKLIDNINVENIDFHKLVYKWHYKKITKFKTYILNHLETELVNYYIKNTL